MKEDLETHLKLLNGEILPKNTYTHALFLQLRERLDKEIKKSRTQIRLILDKYGLNDDCMKTFEREHKAIATIGVEGEFPLSIFLLEGEHDTFTARDSIIICYSTMGFLYAVRCLFYLYYDQTSLAISYYTAALKDLFASELLSIEHEMNLGETLNIHKLGGEIKKQLAKVWQEVALAEWNQHKFSSMAAFSKDFCMRKASHEGFPTDYNTVARYLYKATKSKKR